MSGTEQEMTLKEWMARLPEHHLANRQLRQLERELTEAKRVAMEMGKETHELSKLLRHKERELAEAQQWLDSEPDWKAKFISGFQVLEQSRDACLRELAEVTQELVDSDKHRVRAASVIVNLQHENSCLKQERDAWRRCAEQFGNNIKAVLIPWEGHEVKECDEPDCAVCGCNKALATYNELKKG